jgi:hypothetical protein
MTDVVEIIRDLAPEIVEIYTEQQPAIVNIVAVGPQGPQGPSGSSNIAGYPVSASGLINGDVLGFNGAAWFNRRQESLADGGNF